MKTIVHVTECFNEDCGAYDKVYYLIGNTLSCEVFTARDPRPTPSVNATGEEIKLAECLYMAQGLRREGRYLIGSVVTLQRSRKAPNKTPVKIVDFSDRYFDGSYWQDAKIHVTWNDGLADAWVAESCIKDIKANALDW
jgi:hypothetical protein